MVLRVLDLFSGIGGFSLGLERTGGFQTVAFCEIEPFPRKVLAKHWPGVPIYDDVRTLTADTLARDGIGVDVICGGFPCQDISVAGNGKGLAGARSGLWGEIIRLARDIRPGFIVVENVANLLNGPSGRPGGWFGRILGDLADIGFDAEWRVIRAAELGVPQARPRVWIVSYPARESRPEVFHQDAEHVASYRAWLDGFGGVNADAYDEDRRARPLPVLGDIFWAAIPDRERSGDNERLSAGVDRYKSLGNTVVPQIPELIGRAILAAEAA